MDLNLRQVRAFVCVAQNGSFTAAAGLLNLSQPALTVQIRSLEETLGVRLLDRNTRIVEVTRIGRELLPAFQRILQESDALLVNTRDLAARRHGTVRMAALPSFAAGVLPEVIAGFRRQHPRIAFVIKDVIGGRATELVQREEVDVAVTGGSLGNGVDVLHETCDRMRVVFPAGHPIAAAPHVTVEALAQHPLILMDRDTTLRQLVAAAFAAAGRFPNAAAEVTYMASAVGLVRAGLGLAILPGSAMEIRAEPSLGSRLIDDASLVRRIALIKKAGRSLPPASASFCEVLIERLREAEKDGA